MTRIVHTIVIEGEDEDVWPFNKDVKQHLKLLQDQAFQEKGLTMTMTQDRDKAQGNGSRASKIASLAGKGVKAGWDFIFKEPEQETVE